MCLGLRQPVQLHIGPGKIVIRRREVRIESDRLLGIFDDCSYLPSSWSIHDKYAARPHIAWISFGP